MEPSTLMRAAMSALLGEPSPFSSMIQPVLKKG
jgi:hypothetical protein